MQAKEKGGQMLLSAGYVVLGGLLIWRPDGSAKVIGWAIGIAALLYGLLHLINYWRTQRMGDGGKSELFLGITFAALGIFCLITPQTVLSFLPFLLGLVLVVDAVGKAQRAFEFRRLGFARWCLSAGRRHSGYCIAAGCAITVRRFPERKNKSPAAVFNSRRAFAIKAGVILCGRV